MMLSGIASFIFLYVPMYFFSRYRQPELRFNTIVNSALMMVCGGLLFGLMNLGHNTKSSRSITSVYELIDQNQKNIALLSNDTSNVETDFFESSNDVYNDLELLKTEFLKHYSPKTQHDYISVEGFMPNNQYSKLIKKVGNYNSLIDEKQKIDTNLFTNAIPYFVCLYQISELQTKLITNKQLALK